MNSWSANRKFLISFLIFLWLVLIIGLPIYFYFHKAPTCFDNKMNGQETGVDCGGVCSKMCVSETLPLLMKGDPRVIEVTPTNYDVVVYVQNPNVYGVVNRAGYTIKLYSATSTIPLQTIKGVTSIPKNTSFVIFNGPLPFVKDVPTRAVFTWNDPLDWERDASPEILLQVSAPILTTIAGKPRVTANLKNPSVNDVAGIELVALIEDTDGNITHASKTVVDALAGGANTDLIFTWPEAFQGTSTSVLIVPHVYPNPSYLYSNES